MDRVEFVVDDFKAATGFAKSLPKKVKEARFILDPRTRAPYRWTPDHVVIARIQGRSVAMADAIYSEESPVANVSIVALPEHGGYAVRCLRHLMRKFPVDCWEATFRSPTDATIAIARRFYDFAYDQKAWQMCQELASSFGEGARYAPTPLLATERNIKRIGLRKLADLDAHGRAQILRLARLPTDGKLVAPNGTPLYHSDAVAMAFDLLNIPIRTRQYVTRFHAAMNMAKTARTLPDPDGMSRVLDMQAVPNFIVQVEAALAALPSDARSGYFNESASSMAFNMRVRDFWTQRSLA
ncbi:hypothetical protein [Sinorhizobium sp. 22678]|uniref:hypothetical protein n=1 Tax=Sinorhizobium sp. 22678 TaxID=3453955 RepID=UPI003F863179